MNYNEFQNYLKILSQRGSKLGLDRIKKLLQLIGNPQDKLKFIHVAGTNGKGSVCAMTSNILIEAGYKVGMYTSPGVTCFEERIQINGVNISREILAEVATYIYSYAESMEDKPTEFEVVTVIGFEYFHRTGCDVVVLEVGMGGKMDATNVIGAPEISVITAIDLDHMEELGSTVSLIAKEKAGIIKDNGNVVFYGQNPEAFDVISEICIQLHAELKCPNYSNLKLISHSVNGSVFEYNELKDLHISLIGKYQIYNASLVLCVMDTMKNKGWNISDEAIRKGLIKTKLPDRFEIVQTNPYFIMDGGHNPHGVTGTIETIKEFFEDKDITVLMGVMADKNVDEIISIIAPIASRFITVTPNNIRAMKAEELASKIRKHKINVFAYDKINEAVKSALDFAGKDGVVVAMGTFYMYSEVKQSLLSCK